MTVLLKVTVSGTVPLVWPAADVTVMVEVAAWSGAAVAATVGRTQLVAALLAETAAAVMGEPAGSDTQAKSIPPARAITQAAVTIILRMPNPHAEWPCNRIVLATVRKVKDASRRTTVRRTSPDPIPLGTSVRQDKGAQRTEFCQPCCRLIGAFQGSNEHKAHTVPGKYAVAGPSR